MIFGALIPFILTKYKIFQEHKLFGRRSLILIANLFVIIGCIFQILINIVESPGIAISFYIGRFLQGIGCGIFQVIIPKFSKIL